MFFWNAYFLYFFFLKKPFDTLDPFWVLELKSNSNFTIVHGASSGSLLLWSLIFVFLGIKLLEQKKSQTVRGTSASPGLLETKQMVRLSLLGQSTRQTGWSSPNTYTFFTIVYTVIAQYELYLKLMMRGKLKNAFS